MAGTDVTLLQAIREALADGMEDDDRVVVLGQDVGRLGGVFRATEGLYERFPGRVFDTPLAEGGIVGASVGLAVGGLVPVAEIQFLGFLHQAFHQVSQQLARYRYRTRGRFHLPVTIRAPYGGGLRMPEFHPDSLEAQLANIPGLRVFAPAFPDDAYALLRAAIQDPDPVLFLEPQRLYRSVCGPLPVGAAVDQPAGVRLRREGEDLLLVGWGPTVHTCLAAAGELAERHDVAAGVLDLRILSPLDREGLCEEAAVRRRVVVVHEGVRTAGLGAEIVATLQESLSDVLSPPIVRVTAPDMPYPPGRLEDAFLPSVTDVVEAALKVVQAS
ncbi:MAG: transketolase C-terminal domain-containing protein [Nocardioides sp.]|nr:transketolase C-terminal domain-containing protein [Nocardioides sp.]